MREPVTTISLRLSASLALVAVSAADALLHSPSRAAVPATTLKPRLTGSGGQNGFLFEVSISITPPQFECSSSCQGLRSDLAVTSVAVPAIRLFTSQIPTARIINYLVT